MKVVKFLVNDIGEKEDNPTWHLVQPFGDAPRTVCTGEVFGAGEGSAIYETKNIKEGKITCPQCLAIIKWYKSIKL